MYIIEIIGGTVSYPFTCIVPSDNTDILPLAVSDLTIPKLLTVAISVFY
jgi:hypothetical protein